MSRYNHLFANHFGSCRLLKVGRDPHRERDVKIYAIPGEFDVVGISDGTDSWVAPVATGFLEDVRKILVRIQAGEDVKPLVSAGRRKIADHALPDTYSTVTGRIKSIAEERQQLLNTALDQQNTLITRSRRVINLPS